MPGYLQDEDEDTLTPLDEEEPPAPRPKPRWWDAAAQGPNPSLNGDSPVPDEDAANPEIPGAMPAGPSIRDVSNPVVKARESAENAVAAEKNKKPAPNSPKWWQRALAGAAGFGAGYINADGKNHPQINVNGAVDTIMGGPQQREKMENWQRGVEGAQANLDAAKANEQGWWKNESLQNDEQYKAAQEERLRAQAKRESGRNDADAAKVKTGDAEKQDALALKGREEDAYILQKGEAAPTGWTTYTSAANPKNVYAVPPRLMKVTDDLAPYATGRKTGDIIPWSEFKRAQVAAQKDTIAQNKPSTRPELEAQVADRTKVADSMHLTGRDRMTYIATGQIHPPPATAIPIPGLGGNDNGIQSKITGQDYMDSLQKAAPGTAAQVKAISEGRQTMPPMGVRGSGALLRDAVYKYDPDFSEQRAQIRRAFTTGTDGRNIASLNTASVHLDQLAEAGKAMANGSFVPGNQVYNTIRSMFGSNAPTNFESLKAAVSSEMAQALKGVATDQEIRQINTTILGSSSPQQLAGAVETNLHTLGAKLQTYHERYQAQIPNDTVWSPVLPSARAVFEKHGFDPTEGVHLSPQGSTGGGRGGQQPAGGGKTADAATIKKYLDAAGGDKNKARKALADGGWIIPKAN